MKKHINFILAALIFTAAMSFMTISCSKETPEPVREEEKQKQDNPEPGKEEINGKQDPAETPEISFENNGAAYAYIGEAVTVGFKAYGEAVYASSVVFASDGKSAVEGSFDPETGRGHVSVKLNEKADHSGSTVTLTVKGGGKDRTYTLDVTAYYLVMSAEDVTLSGEEGQSADLKYTVDTNITGFEPVIETDAQWLVFRDGELTAVEENTTGKTRVAIVTLSDKESRFDKAEAKVYQEALNVPETKPGCVAFKEWNFKNACLAIADTDSDGEISFEEAEAIEELVAVGKGIKDLTGLDAFRNLWKVDLRDNDIEDADILKELHLLHWLDLTGNKNLRTFDLTGCTIYFDHCKYATPENLRYTVLRRQVGVSGGQEYGFNSDPYCKYSKHIRDERVTTDWSRQDELVLIKPHTKTWKKDGKEMSYAICLTGMGYIDVDINDGSLDRLMRDSAEKLPICGDLKDKWDYFDVYYMSHIMESRFKYQFPKEEFWEETGKAISEAGLIELREINETAYKKIFNDDDSGTKKLIIIFLCLTNFPNQTGLQGDYSSLPLYLSERSKYKKCMRNAYRQNNSLSSFLEDENEWYNLMDRTPQMNLFFGMEDDINTILSDIF